MLEYWVLIIWEEGVSVAADPPHRSILPTFHHSIPPGSVSTCNFLPFVFSLDLLANKIDFNTNRLLVL
jgi:hypothetical protein